MLILASCLLAAAQAEAIGASVRHDTPLQDKAKLTISTDRESYYAKEPIQLTIALRNVANEPIRGFFDVDPGAPNTEIYFRIDGGPFLRLGYPSRTSGVTKGGRRWFIDYFVRPVTLQPNQEKTKTRTVSMDSSSGRPVLDQPGEYEFKAVYRDLRGNLNALVSSRTIRIRVEAPPPSEAGAALRYSDPSVAQFAQPTY